MREGLPVLSVFLNFLPHQEVIDTKAFELIDDVRCSIRHVGIQWSGTALNAFQHDSFRQHNTSLPAAMLSRIELYGGRNNVEMIEIQSETADLTWYGATDRWVSGLHGGGVDREGVVVVIASASCFVHPMGLVVGFAARQA